MSLRARLLATLLLLVAIGLVVADVATYSALRSFLFKRVDAQLQDARGPALGALIDGHKPGLFGVYVEYRDPTGVKKYPPDSPSPDDPNLYGSPPPTLPAALPGSGTGGSQRLFDAHGSTGSLNYRVLASAVPPDVGGGTLIVAIPLTDVTSTLHRLILLMLGVGAAVLIAVAGVALWRVRAGLRPWRRWVRPPGPSRPAT